MQMVIRIEKRNNGYRAWCPALPGCVVLGETSQEAHRRIQQMVKGYFASLDRPVSTEPHVSYLQEEINQLV